MSDIAGTPPSYNCLLQAYTTSVQHALHSRVINNTTDYYSSPSKDLC